MSDRAQRLAQLLLQKNSLDECNLQDLQALARQYPYFGAIQLLMAEKLRSQHPSVYQKQLQKTALYFHDPFWFDYLLNEEDYNQKEIIVEEPKRDFDELTHAMNQETAQVEIEETPEAPAEPVQQLPPEPEAVPNVGITETPSDTVEHSAGAGFPLEEPDDLDAALPVETTVSVANDSLPEPEGGFHPIAVEEPESAQALSHEDENYEPASPETEQSIAPLIKPFQFQENAGVLSFEPYHTVDYFASQGIKLSADDRSTDRFGRQLRSFTEWLKTMKKLPQAEITKHIDAGAEKKVVVLAEHSLENRDVVTEAMAEVWEKQGNREKAIEIYNKLSLLDPSKSAYFAAKIEQLKR